MMKQKKALLQIKNLTVTTEGKKILNGVALDVMENEVHALMGPNGSGKSTLSYVLMGHPSYEVTSGEIIFKGKNILEMETDERSKLGLFLSFQYPMAIPGVTVLNFLRTAMNARLPKEKQLSVVAANKILQKHLENLHMEKSFLQRYVNDGFSGGEKKRMEILQLSVLNPSLAILDETDSGTDVDALRIISQGINELRKQSPLSLLLITHYDRILTLIKPDRVSVLVNGKIVDTGDASLASRIEKEGYKKYM